MAVLSPMAGPVFTTRCSTVLPGWFTTQTNRPCVPRSIAEVGTITVSWSVSASRRTLTNWFGYKAPSLLSNRALARTVPVVVSTWLSRVRSLPRASWVFCVRSNAAASSTAPRMHALSDLRQVVLGHGEQHVDGRDLGHHHDAVGVAGGDIVAGVDLAQTHPARHGRGDPGIGEVQLLGADRRLVGLDRALNLAHQRALGVHLLAGDGVLRQQGLIALQVDAGVVELRLVARQRALGLQQLLLDRGADRPGPGPDPCATIWPSLKATLSSWPLIWVRTVTVCAGVAVPSA